MPISCVATCAACERRQFLLSDGLAVQLDDGTLQHLRHPGESYDCKKLGLTLSDASKRVRLFHRTFLICRQCGHDSVKTQAVPRYPRGLDEPISWSMYWHMIAFAGIWIPVAGYFHRWDLAFVVGTPLIVAVPLDQWKAHRRRRKRGERILPTADAPGRTSISLPKPSPPCCNQPDLVEVAKLFHETQIQCRHCGNGILVIGDWAIH